MKKQTTVVALAFLVGAGLATAVSSQVIRRGWISEYQRAGEGLVLEVGDWGGYISGFEGNTIFVRKYGVAECPEPPVPNYPAGEEALSMIYQSQNGGEPVQFRLEGECMPAGFSTKR
jgi:hypothetical protein